MLAPPRERRTDLSYMIERACDPLLNRPDQSLNFEIKDWVNTKKANSPREAAVEVLRYINDRRDNVSSLGLELLDILVKNCGYPFHLQIATKDFLNELVRRFPERPPLRYPPWMGKILRLIHEWRNTICFSSKYKEDLVHIRDMHRLLGYKGYRFPEIDRRAESVLNPTDNLKTADELEEEDRAAQGAKLQELIRRGTPKDLAAAQELMKLMSGAEPNKAVDYEAQTRKELDKVQNRVLLLNEMLDNAKDGERFVDGDTYDQISQQCKKVQPKLQQWITEAATSDPEAMDRLLLINDMTNQVLSRYKSFKKGDFTASAEINPALLPPEKAAAVRAAAVNLIDFDFDDSSAPSASTSTAAAGATIDDALGGLEGLNLGGGAAAFPGSSAPTAGHAPLDLQGLYNSAPAQQNRPASSFFDTLAGPSASASTSSSLAATQQSTSSSSGAASPIQWPSHMQGGGAIALGSTGMSRPASAAGGSFAQPGRSTPSHNGAGSPLASGFGGAQQPPPGYTNGAAVVQPQQSQQQQQQTGGVGPAAQPAQGAQKKNDAFEDLLGLF